MARRRPVKILQIYKLPVVHGEKKKHNQKLSIQFHVYTCFKVINVNVQRLIYLDVVLNGGDVALISISPFQFS